MRGGHISRGVLARHREVGESSPGGAGATRQLPASPPEWPGARRSEPGHGAAPMGRVRRATLGASEEGSMKPDARHQEITSAWTCCS